MANAIPEKIDVHSHYLPSSYWQQCKENGHSAPDGFPYLPEWDLESHLQMADKMNITKSYLSISSPGVHLVPNNDELARKISRECNLVGADAKQRYPDRFGFWASLPLPDVQGSLDELRYAFDELHADGVVVMTNSHGVYLGNLAFEPVWAELNRRHAVVFLHPTTGCCQVPGADGVTETRKAAPLAAYPSPIFEFFFDTARAVISLFYSGAVSRYPDITYIVPHAGGCLAPLIDRFALFGRAIPGLPVHESVTLESVRASLRSNFYFDMAGTPFPHQLPALLEYVDRDKVLYGSDYPFTSAQFVEILAGAIEQHLPKAFETEEEQARAYKGNAETLFRNQAAARRASTA